MSLTPKSRGCILAVGAHPDDIEFGCGGVLLAEAARGNAVHFHVCSRGESSTNGSSRERESEARCAAGVLGATLKFFNLGGDSHIAVSVENTLAIARSIRTVRPDILLAPTTVSDQHPDHVAVGQICAAALRLARYGGIAELRELPSHAVGHFFTYAVTPGGEPARSCAAVHVDISQYFGRWVQLMECHKTQLRTRDYIELQTARARLLGVQAGVEYAQALFLSDHLLVKTLAELPPSIRLF
ncbi:MAG: PIG-L family deacetylase [Chthoniobacterales bacterium]